MKKARIGFLIATILLGTGSMLFLNISCQQEGVAADQMQKIPFADVQQVYTEYCIQCHSAGENGLDLATPAGILSSVTPGNSEKSQSYQAMIRTFQRMPPDNVVPANKRTIVRLWIDQGAHPE